MLLSFLKTFFGTKSTEEINHHELDDSELMVRYAQGDQKAFQILFERHKQPLYNFILRSCGRRDLADELLQDVFLRIVKGAATYEPSAKFTTWAYTIARNTCIDAARKRSRADVYSLQNHLGDDDEQGETHQDRIVDEEARSSSVDVDRQAFRDRLQQALLTLPEEQREVFVLREISGLKFREIADVLDIPLPTVKSRMRYALQGLRGELAEFRDHQFDDEDKLEMVP